MTLRDELERLDNAAVNGKPYGYKQFVWRQMLDALDAVDALGVAIADAGYIWTPAMREAYERASDSAPVVQRTPSGLCTHDDPSWCTDECRPAPTVAADSASDVLP